MSPWRGWEGGWRTIPRERASRWLREVRGSAWCPPMPSVVTTYLLDQTLIHREKWEEIEKRFAACAWPSLDLVSLPSHLPSPPPIHLSAILAGFRPRALPNSQVQPHLCPRPTRLLPPPPSAMSAPAVPGGAATPATKDVSDQVILDYLNRRGFTRAASALTAELGTDGASATGGGKAIALGDLAERNAPSANRPAGLAGVPAPPGPGVKRRPDQAVAGGQLLADPPSWEKGYEGLRTFVENVRLLSGWERVELMSGAVARHP